MLNFAARSCCGRQPSVTMFFEQVDSEYVLGDCFTIVAIAVSVLIIDNVCVM